MARTFSLAALLRLRHIEQDAAAGELAAANARLRTTAMRRARARTELGETVSEPDDVEAMNAVAAARAAARSMLAELEATSHVDLAALAEARRGLSAARVRSIGLEKLAEKHHDRVAAEELRSEQSMLDELASTAWHRARQGTDG